MKSVIISLVTASIFATGCAPRDSKLINPKSNGTRVDAQAATDGKADNYKYIAILTERAVETVEIFRALTDADFAASRKINIVSLDATSGVQIVSSDTTIAAGAITATRKLNLAAKVQKDESGKVLVLNLKEDQRNLSSEKASRGPKDDVSVNNKITDASVVRTDDGGYTVQLILVEEVNKPQGKSLMTNRLQFVFTSIDGAPDVFKLSRFRMNHMRSGAQVGDFNLTSDPDSVLQLEIKTASHCASLSGNLHLNSVEFASNKGVVSDKPLYDRTLTFDQSNLNLKAGKDNFKLDAASCENRSTVDIGKLL